MSSNFEEDAVDKAELAETEQNKVERSKATTSTSNEGVGSNQSERQIEDDLMNKEVESEDDEVPITLAEEEDLDDDEEEEALESTPSLHSCRREMLPCEDDTEGLQSIPPRCSMCCEEESDTSSEVGSVPTQSVVEADIEYEIITKHRPDMGQSTEGILEEKDLEFRDILASADVQVIFKAMKRNTALCAKHMHEAAEHTADNVQTMIKSVKTGTSLCAKHIQDAAEDAAENVQLMFRTMKENTATAAKQVSEAAGDQAQKVGRKILEVGKQGWYVLSHPELPEWMRDNEFLFHAHRPELASFKDCFKSIFRIHTETGNIWTHLIGFVAFICVMCYTYIRPVTDDNPFPKNWQDKLVFGVFFAGAILCLGFSWLFHAVCCHSPKVSRVFSRLDYTGISLLIMGSFVPALYYGFYCNQLCKIIYFTCMTVLGVSTIILSLWAKFSTPKYRPLRAGIFIALGCSGVIPSLHFLITMGLTQASKQASLGWMALMGLLYIIGALMYATRIPERFFPKKCNIWFQSHQIFHVFVVAAAFVHHHGICQMASYRVAVGSSCD